VKIFDFKVYDFISSVLKEHPQHAKESNVIIVDIDENSLKAVGQWPWPRIVIAQLIGKLERLNTTAIGFDMIFPEKDRTSPTQIALFYKKFFNIDKIIDPIPNNLRDNDKIFSYQLKQSSSTMSLYLSKEYIVGGNGCNNLHSIENDFESLKLDTYNHILCNTTALVSSAKYSGFINSNIDEDGILRRMPLFKKYKQTVIPAFSLAVLLNIDSNLKIFGDRTFEILDHKIKTDEKSNVLFKIYDDDWYKKISAIDLLSNNFKAEMLTGKIVLLGSSAVSLHDQIVVSGGKRFIGVKVHTTIIDNILNGELLVQPTNYKYINIFLSILLSLVLFLLFINKRNILILIFFVSLALLLTVFTIYAYTNGTYLSIGYLILPFIIHFFIVGILYIIINSYERHKFIEELNRSHVALLDSMVHVAEVHDLETGAHIMRTKKYIKLLAQHIYSKGIYKKELSPKFIEMMYRTAPLHDLGKVGIEDCILKKQGKLTPMEYEVMKTHPDLGRHIINNAMMSYKENDFFAMAKNIAYGHHEKWDGTGYPEGLKGYEIPIECRFMALADVYDALVSKRVYKEAFSFERSNKIIIECKGSHFDPVLVEAFEEIKDQFEEIAQRYSDCKI
jgi:adenylate cyclase